MTKMRGHIGAGKCKVPGHGHSHMNGAPNGYVCEMTTEMPRTTRTDEKREARREIEEDLSSLAQLEEALDSSPR